MEMPSDYLMRDYFNIPNDPQENVEEEIYIEDEE
jgi:hypothetical protein